MLNSVTMTGRLTKDIDLRYTQGGDAVGSFILAVDRRFKNGNGEREADFVNCVIWRKSAENLAKYASKGSMIGVEGRIQTRNYENNQGTRVYVTEVVVNNFAFLSSNKGNNQANSQTNNQVSANKAANTQEQINEFNPFSGEPLTIDDNDLPF